jgi:pyrimidine-nucleoside phosphorylase
VSGVAVIAQSPDIDPADKKMYALRDVTATVPSIPLIVGSIISKKVAGGADAILLDVKVGSGAFMKTESEARQLAAELTRVGAALGKGVHCVMSDMDQPLGMAVGNALEVIEAIETLRCEGPVELTELCLELAGKMLVLGGVAASEGDGRWQAEQALSSGAAIRTFERWVEAQGGDPRVATDLSLLPRADLSREVLRKGRAASSLRWMPRASAGLRCRSVQAVPPRRMSSIPARGCCSMSGSVTRSLRRTVLPPSTRRQRPSWRPVRSA